MKKIMKKAHEMTREMVKEYKVDYQAQLGLNLSYLLTKKEEKEEMIKLYETTNGDLYFADVEKDLVYEVSLDDELVEYEDMIIDDWFDIETAVEVKIEDYYKVKHLVDEKNTYAIKDIIKAEGGKWDGAKWEVSGPSENFKTKTLLIEL